MSYTPNLNDTVIKWKLNLMQVVSIILPISASLCVSIILSEERFVKIALFKKNLNELFFSTLE
ncbi:6177_t:CDS:2 [Funneliformis geosporum]|nr:6177_t:CDS:2 [Funneliformis geosporum]